MIAFHHVEAQTHAHTHKKIHVCVCINLYQAPRKQTYLLVTHIVGQALDIVQDKTESEIKDLCLQTLRTIFPGKVGRTYCSQNKWGRKLL